MLLPLSLRQLEVFVRVAESLSFSEASKALHVSQPALTRNIQQTEHILGARLFDRDTRNVKLSTVGIELLPIARRILEEFQVACGEISHFVEGLQGKLILAAVPSVAAGLLPAALATFHKNHPQVDVRITELRSLFIPAAVADGICDFGLSVPPADGRVGFKQLFNDELVVVCRMDDPIAKMKSVPWNAFRARPWIAFTHGNSIRAIAESIFQTLKINITPKYECQYFSTIGRLIENGLGISVLSSLMFKQIQTDCIVARPLIQPSASRSVGVVTRIGRTPPPAAKEILEAIVTSVSRFSRGSAPVSGR